MPIYFSDQIVVCDIQASPSIDQYHPQVSHSKVWQVPGNPEGCDVTQPCTCLAKWWTCQLDIITHTQTHTFINYLPPATASLSVKMPLP